MKNPLRISFAEDRVTVRCQTPLGKVVDEFAPVSMEGDAVEIGFNNRYLLDALRFSKCEKMVLEINGPLSPVKLLPEDGKDLSICAAGTVQERGLSCRGRACPALQIKTAARLKAAAARLRAGHVRPLRMHR